jgi:hypothetical protein
MGIKTLITLLLGLAFQLAQVLPGGIITAPCATANTPSCECCAGSKSCCCATSETPAPKPTPQPANTGGLLKDMAMKASDTRVSEVAWHNAGLPATLPALQASAPPAGFAGVRLAVAFCSFVI